MPPESTVALIHSPLVGPASWSRVGCELERRGRAVVVPSLLDIAGAQAPQWRHVPAAVRAAVAGSEGPVLLVGHSGAGPLLPTIAEVVTEAVAGLIFVDAHLPPPSGRAPLAPPALLGQLRALAEDGVLPPWSGWFAPGAMGELVPDASLRAALEQEMPRLPLHYFEANVPLPEGWEAGRCAYLLLSDTYGESAGDARRRGWPVAELPDAGHLATATNPIAVTDALLELERGIRSGQDYSLTTPRRG